MTRIHVLSLSLVLGLAACSEAAPASPSNVESPPAAAAAEAAVPVVSVDQVAALLEAGSATPIDANSPDTRTHHGTLPGARLLTSSSDYDVATELPTDHASTLVFYCANEHCSASDAAAHRAVSAGYADVRLMRAGIAGWEAAGKPTDHPES
ncbi:MAG: rhodanese-like domain-containing protein [Myxococcales bacterium]|nr:rhodanese-like domain-containing protein [Myxococcales bacterium]